MRELDEGEERGFEFRKLKWGWSVGKERGGQGQRKGPGRRGAACPSGSGEGRAVVAAAPQMAPVCECHPHTAPPQQMPASCFLLAWHKAPQLSFPIFPTSWLPPQPPPGLTGELDGPVPSPRGS